MKAKLLILPILIISLTACVTTSKSTSPTEQVKTNKSTAKYVGSNILVIKPISFNNDNHIRDAVKNECNLNGKLIQFIEKNAASHYSNILTDIKSTPTNAQVLTIEIEQVQGGSGGAWSGGKSVLINGTLTQKGKELGNFKARRYSGGGVFAAYKGTCAILGRCVKTLGKDVAKWLSNPTKKAVLGDL